MRCRFLGLITSAVVLMQGCSTPDETPLPPAEHDFSVFPAHASMLPEIERNAGEVSVCIAVIDAPAEELESWRARTRANMDDTVKKWNDLLRNNPWWSIPEVRTSYVYVEGQRCALSAAMVKVNVWTTVDRFKADHCATRRICASSAAPNDRAFFLGPWNRAVKTEPLDPFVTLHEYGHLLGVGDTYTIPDLNAWIGEQPASVMGGTSAALTEDDRLGLWVALRAVKTGVRSCDGFGKELQMTANNWNVVMCDSKGFFIDTHGEVIFQLGPIPAAALNQAKQITIGAQALNCRSGPGVDQSAVAPTSRGESYDTEEESPGVRFRTAADGTPWVRLTIPDAAGQRRSCYVVAKYEYIALPP